MRVARHSWKALLGALVLAAPLCAQDGTSQVLPGLSGQGNLPMLNSGPQGDVELPPQPAPSRAPATVQPAPMRREYFPQPKYLNDQQYQTPGAPPVPLSGPGALSLREYVHSSNWSGSYAGSPPFGGTGGDMYSGMRVGSPGYWSTPGSVGVGGIAGSYHGGDVFGYHFGPGLHRHSNYGHYRFPYYNYRAPWYYVGPPSYNRDTNYPW